uniref:UDP-D-xylose:beta-D-glucoside alpha-1,3-D-xylosyltransferase n=1 Tax=Culicoides sonorensis TaxID=179676 RepID=A0A336MJQ6_CULSO
MKFQFKWLCLAFGSTLVLWQLVNFFHNDNINNISQRQIPTIAVVICGDRMQEALNMLKSALIFNRHTNERVHFVIITESDLMSGFREKLNDWKSDYNLLFDYEIHPLQFPDKNRNEWRKLFKPCAAQRLFLPNLLNHIDSVLYLDSDTLFLSPTNEIWSFFEKFNATQIAGMAPEHEDKNAGWYNRFSRHPFYPPLGVNSGVMLMNLTRMRQFNWTERILPIYEEYKMKLVWGDQDILNILFHFHPEKLFIFSCEFNYRSDFCMYMPICKTNCIKILHGNRGYFHSLAQPIFSYIYKAIEEYQFNMEPYKIIKVIETNLAIPDRNTNCDKLSDIFMYNMKRFFKNPNDNLQDLSP